MKRLLQKHKQTNKEDEEEDEGTSNLLLQKHQISFFFLLPKSQYQNNKNMQTTNSWSLIKSSFSSNLSRKIAKTWIMIKMRGCCLFTFFVNNTKERDGERKRAIPFPFYVHPKISNQNERPKPPMHYDSVMHRSSMLCIV